jgi:glycosyltransferase involved in cell wall biosynthesis
VTSRSRFAPQNGMRGLHQFVPTLEPGAVGQHLLEVQRLCRELGVASDVFTEFVAPPMRGHGRDFREYRGAAGDVLLYHVAIGSPVGDFVAARPEPLVVDHHNITPAAYYLDWEPPVVHGIAWGRNQLAALAPRTTLGLADSGFNRGELDALGYQHTQVAPILLDTSSFDRAVDEAAAERLAHAGGAAWLFVGRLAPNKCQHDLIKAFAAYRRVYDPAAVLRIVGGSSSDRYLDALQRLVRGLHLQGAVELTGGVSDAELAAHYRSADVFVCVSEHEGFCVPLLEAMHHGVPIVAYGATAVPETLGAGGLCLPTKAPTTVAAAVDRVLRDGVLRDQLVAAGRARLDHFALARTRATWRAAIEGVLG